MGQLIFELDETLILLSRDTYWNFDLLVKDA